MKTREVGTITVVTPKGYLTGGDETEELEQTIKGLIDVARSPPPGLCARGRR